MGKKKVKELLKLDIGCGTKKKEGFHGVDSIKFPGVDTVVRLGSRPLPFAAGSVGEVYSSHFLEHLDQTERCFFMNDLYRVMAPGSSMTLIVPHWASGRAYGDPTHKWPAISEMWFWYLDKKWRAENAPHSDAKNWKQGYSCDFEFTYGYLLHSAISTRAQDQQQFAVSFYKEACQDIQATLKPKK